MNVPRWIKFSDAGNSTSPTNNGSSIIQSLRIAHEASKNVGIAPEPIYQSRGHQLVVKQVFGSTREMREVAISIVKHADVI